MRELRTNAVMQPVINTLVTTMCDLHMGLELATGILKEPIEAVEAAVRQIVEDKMRKKCEWSDEEPTLSPDPEKG